LIENIEDLDNIFSSSYNYHYEIQQLDLQPYPDDNVVPFLGWFMDIYNIISLYIIKNIKIK